MLCDLISKPTMPSGTTSKAAIKRKAPVHPRLLDYYITKLLEYWITRLPDY